MTNRRKVCAKSDENDIIREYCISNGKNNLTGTVLKFSMLGRLESCETRFEGSTIGTSMYWLDNGEKFYEIYKSPDFPGETFDRQFVVEFASVMHDGPQEEYHRRYVADAVSVNLNTQPYYCEGKIKLIDAKAEEISMPRERLSGRESICQWASGCIDYIGEFDRNQIRYGGHVRFWENGHVRSVASWDSNSVIGTRCCFDSLGQLVAEQYFGRLGWRIGSWVNRFFDWSDCVPKISRIEVFCEFDMRRAWDFPKFNGFVDDVSLNRFADSLLFNFIVTKLDRESKEWIEIGPIEFSKEYSL